MFYTVQVYNKHNYCVADLFFKRFTRKMAAMLDAYESHGYTVVFNQF